VPQRSSSKVFCCRTRAVMSASANCLVNASGVCPSKSTTWRSTMPPKGVGGDRRLRAWRSQPLDRGIPGDAICATDHGTQSSNLGFISWNCQMVSTKQKQTLAVRRLTAAQNAFRCDLYHYAVLSNAVCHVSKTYQSLASPQFPFSIA
jgi:hypothetical protein